MSESEPPIKKLKPTDEGAFEKKAKFQAAFDRVVFIDSTWHTVNKISQDERLAGWLDWVVFFQALQHPGSYYDLYFQHVPTSDPFQALHLQKGSING